MGRYIPIDILERVQEAIFITDEEGRVELCNPAAAALLKRDRAEIEGRHCWEITRFRSAEGKLLCNPKCAVQRQARRGKLPHSQPALLPSSEGVPVKLEVVSIPVSPPRGSRLAILHVLSPSPDLFAKGIPSTDRRGNGDRLECLSPREKEVLGQLARGMSTEEVAGALFLSATTVRNHVRSILSKLHVHSRIEAVLTSVAGQR